MSSYRIVAVHRIFWISLAISLSLVTAYPVLADESLTPPPQTDPIIAPTSTSVVPPIIISEIAWAGSSVSTSDEWIELFNRTDSAIDLAGYSFWDAAGTTPKLMVSISSGQIGINGFFLISNNGPEHSFSAGLSVLNVAPDIVNSDVSLSNSNLKIQLRDAAGLVIDMVGSGGAGFWRDTVTPRSMIRILSPIGDGTLKASWSLATTKTGLDATAPDFGTPTSSGRPSITLPTSCKLLRTIAGEQPIQDIFINDPDGLVDIASITASVGSEILPIEQVVGSTSIVLLVWATDATPTGPLILIITASDQSGLTTIAQLPCARINAVGDVLINEVMGSPEESGQEFVELRNVGSSDVDLFGWTLDDIDTGGSSQYTIGYPLHLAAGQLIAFAATETKLAFNNAGDDVQLRRPTGERADLVRYQGDLTAQSWNRGTPWYWSNPSPGRPNNDSPPIEGPAQGGAPVDVSLVQHLTLHQIVEAGKTLAGQTVETEATVAVPQGPYNARRLIIGDGQDFMELQVHEDVKFPFGVGARLHLTASVSTSATPRLLLDRLEDATVIGNAIRPIGSVLSPDRQKLAQLVSGDGTVEQVGVTPTLKTAGQTVKLSRRSGVQFPQMKSGDTVHYLGVVTSLNPLQIKILEETDLKVDPVSTPVVALVAPSSSVPSPADLPERTVATPSLPTVDTNAVLEAEAMLGQLPLITITASVHATADLLARRQAVIGALETEVAAATKTQKPTAMLLSLQLLMMLSGLAVFSQVSDLLWQQLRRRVNGP